MDDKNISTIPEDEVKQLKSDLERSQAQVAELQGYLAGAQSVGKSYLAALQSCRGVNLKHEKQAVITNMQIKKLNEQIAQQVSDIADLMRIIRIWENKKWYDFF